MMSDLLDQIDEFKKNILIDLKCSYGLNQDANDLLEGYFDSNLNHECLDNLQHVLVGFILNDHNLKSFKPNWKYRKAFLKKIISIFEKLNYEVNEEIFDTYIKIINDPGTNLDTKDEQKYFISFFSKNDIFERPIIIEQYASIIANGTTGLHVWPACFQLIDYLERNKNLIERKNVLELGAGVGLLGLQCFRLATIKHYSFTDCHSLVLKQIERNVLLNNKDDLENEEPNDFKDKKISIKKLDWTSLEDSNLFTNKNNCNLDTILASDIIFDPELMPALAKSLSFIWSNQQVKNNLVFIIASTIRNQSTYNEFLKNLEIENFKYESIEKDLAKTKSSTPDCMIEILKILK